MSFVKDIFGGGDLPPPAAAPTPPGQDAASIAAADAAATAERERRLNTGRAATNPTGGLGDTSAPSLAAKALLGQ